MDWTKAKTILIGALLVANIFMLYIFLDKEKEPTAETLHEETIALLKTKNIFVEGELPALPKKMPVLMVEYSYVDESTIKEKLKNQTEPVNYKGTMEEDIEIAGNFLEHCDIEYDTAEFSDYIRDDSQKKSLSKVFYINRYKGIKVEDSYIVCTLSEGRVVDLDIFWLKPTGQGKAKKSTISPSAALMELMRGKKGSEAIFVNKIEMIYWLDPSFPPGETAVADTALPTWKIDYNGGFHLFVPAYAD